MDCHGLPWQERAAIGLKEQQAYSNNEGVLPYYKTGAAIAATPAIVAPPLALLSRVPVLASAGTGTSLVTGSGLSAETFAFTANAYTAGYAETVALQVSTRFTVQWATRVVVADTVMGGIEGAATGNGPTQYPTEDNLRSYLPNNAYRDAAQAGAAATHNAIERLLNKWNIDGQSR